MAQNTHVDNSRVWPGPRSPPTESELRFIYSQLTDRVLQPVEAGLHLGVHDPRACAR